MDALPVGIFSVARAAHGSEASNPQPTGYGMDGQFSDAPALEFDTVFIDGELAEVNSTFEHPELELIDIATDGSDFDPAFGPEEETLVDAGTPNPTVFQTKHAEEPEFARPLYLEIESAEINGSSSAPETSIPPLVSETTPSLGEQIVNEKKESRTDEIGEPAHIRPNETGVAIGVSQFPSQNLGRPRTLHPQIIASSWSETAPSPLEKINPIDQTRPLLQSQRTEVQLPAQEAQTLQVPNSDLRRAQPRNRDIEMPTQFRSPVAFDALATSVSEAKLIPMSRQLPGPLAGALTGTVLSQQVAQPSVGLHHDTLLHESGEEQKVLAPELPQVALERSENGLRASRPQLNIGGFELTESKFSALPHAVSIATTPESIAVSYQAVPEELSTQISLNGSQPLPPLSSVTPTNASPPATAQAVAQQIATAMSDASQSDGVIEVALDPPELGRVRLAVTEVQGAIMLTIHAERPETADLMRRHLETLHQQFARDGLEGASVNIAQDGKQGNSSPDQESEGLDIASDPIEQDSPQASRNLSEGSTLDMRL